MGASVLRNGAKFVWPKHGDVVQNDSYMGIKSMSCDITSCTDSQPLTPD